MIISFHIFTWLTAEEYEKVLLQESLKTLRVATRSEECKCRYDSECHNDKDCNIQEDCTINEGCGPFGKLRCDGLCTK